MTSKIILIHALSPMKTTDTENFKQKKFSNWIKKIVLLLPSKCKFLSKGW